MSDYFDLGQFSRPVGSTDEAQRWCDRGLIWCYGYNHDEAVVCFKKAIEADPECVLAHWGVAYASGCNYNKAWNAFDPEDAERSLAQASEFAHSAATLAKAAAPVDKALVEALQKRYQSRQVPEFETFCSWNADYAAAMREVYRQFPDDLDVAALFAEAIMNLTPWRMWDLATGGIAEGAGTAEAIEVLERAMERGEAYEHPGVLHMYIHLMEMSPYPERAVRAADALRHLVPDSGHLNHMSTHIDVLCGNYERVVTSNSDAIIADLKYLEKEGPLNFYSLYRCHNYHFKIYGAMFLGQYKLAITAAEEMLAHLPKRLLEVQSPPMADWLEGFASVKQHVYIRFGKWDEIIAQEQPEDQSLYCVTNAMMRYAKAVAYAASGRVPEALEQARLFEEAYGNVPSSRMLFNNTCRDILDVGRQMMYGEIEYRQGDFDAAFKYLRDSVTMDDNLPYDEPWGWMQPTRHALGALLLEQGRVEESAMVYRADLGLDATLARAVQHPDNIWSLQGYHECLRKLGREDEAVIIAQRLTLAKARTDVPVRASCFCKMGSR